MSFELRRVGLESQISADVTLTSQYAGITISASLYIITFITVRLYTFYLPGYHTACERDSATYIVMSRSYRSDVNTALVYERESYMSR